MSSPPPSPNTPVTMADIARECGVTKMTVSRVLAGGDKVKPETQARVLTAARQLNYEINTLARNLTQGRSGYIGVATPFEGLLGTSYIGECFQGFAAGIEGTDLDFALFDSLAESFNDAITLERMYRRKRFEGLLVVAAHMDDSFQETLRASGLPLVVVGEESAAPEICSVSCDDARGIELMCEHLYALGHRRMAFVEGRRNLKTANRRRDSYLAFCKSRNLEVPAAYLQPGKFSMSGGREAGLALLQLDPRPTAVIAANDAMAIGVMESARQLSLRVPEDVSVVGYDDLKDAADYFPALTTIRQPVQEMGRQSARILCEALETGTPPKGRNVLEVTLVKRNSAAPTGLA